MLKQLALVSFQLDTYHALHFAFDLPGIPSGQQTVELGNRGLTSAGQDSDIAGRGPGSFLSIVRYLSARGPARLQDQEIGLACLLCQGWSGHLIRSRSGSPH